MRLGCKGAVGFGQERTFDGVYEMGVIQSPAGLIPIEDRPSAFQLEAPALVPGDAAWFANLIKSHPRVFPWILFNTKFDTTTQAFYMQIKLIINEFAFISFKRQI